MSVHNIRNAFIVAAVMAAMLPQSSYAENTPITVTMISSPGSGFPGVTIATIADDIVVTNVIFNRGNCGRKGAYGDRWPAKLKFGETVNVYGTTACNLIEVNVSTNKGDWTFKWK